MAEAADLEDERVVLERFYTSLLKHKKTDAVCEFQYCHYPSTDICVKSAGYKGHVTLRCTNGCAISCHAFCWQRYRRKCDNADDGDYLRMDCRTPNCPGTIDTVHVYNNREKMKITYETWPKDSPKSEDRGLVEISRRQSEEVGEADSTTYGDCESAETASMEEESRLKKVSKQPPVEKEQGKGGGGVGGATGGGGGRRVGGRCQAEVGEEKAAMETKKSRSKRKVSKKDL